MRGTIPTSERKLTEVARHVIRPQGIETTGWNPIEKQCTAMGISFDEWQRGMGKLILAKTRDGKYAATVGGVGMSLPRQVGKTYTVGAIIFALCIRNSDMTVIWTSHHMKTTNETFRVMQGFAERERIKPYIHKVFTGSNDEELRFTNGSRILFGAREKGFGRGFSDVDLLICDEAQILTDRALDNLLAPLNTAPNGLAIFMGTPPKPGDESEAFERMRTEALNGEVSDMVWIECGAPEDSDPDDRNAWAIANPSYPHRTPLTSLMRMRRKLTIESWFREGLGIWRNADQFGRLDLSLWARLLDRQAAQPNRVALVIDVSPDRKWSSIGVAGDHRGKIVILSKTGRGTEWATSEVLKLRKSHSIAEVALVVSGQARGLQADFRKAGIDFQVLHQPAISASCVAFQGSMKANTIVHVGQAELDVAVANARTRKLGESEIWDRTKESIDISPVVACAAAAYRWNLEHSQKTAIY